MNILIWLAIATVIITFVPPNGDEAFEDPWVGLIKMIYFLLVTVIILFLDKFEWLPSVVIGFN